MAYESITSFIEPIEKMRMEHSSGKWNFDTGSAGTHDDPIIMPDFKYSKTLNDFVNAFIPLSLGDYMDVIESYGVDLQSPDLDIEHADARLTLAMLTFAWRADHFCEGALEEYIEAGFVERCLKRLQEIDEESAR